MIRMQNLFVLHVQNSERCMLFCKKKTGKNENRWFVKIVSMWVAFYFHNHGIMLLYNIKNYVNQILKKTHPEKRYVASSNHSKEVISKHVTFIFLFSNTDLLWVFFARVKVWWSYRYVNVYDWGYRSSYGYVSNFIWQKNLCQRPQTKWHL